MTPTQAAKPTVWDRVSEKIVFAVIIGAAIWLVSHEVQLYHINNSRFTNTDAIDMERRLQEGRVPEWLKEQIADIKVQEAENAREIKVQLREISERVRKVEISVGVSDKVPFRTQSNG